MPLKVRNPRVRLVKWPTPDWYCTPWGYRFIKSAFQGPVRRFARVQAKGLENVPESGPALLAPNHFSWADPICLGVALKRPAFYLAKERLFDNRILAAFLEAHGQIKVDRKAGGNEGAIATACNLLAQGLIVGVFPEGTRSRAGELKRGKTGIARIALASGAPVLPVAMTTDALWPKHRALPKPGGPVYVNIGKPMRFERPKSEADERALARDSTDEIMARVRLLLDEAYEAKERGDAWE